ncbi:MAG: VOC family protein [Pseudomonadota bacterium]
MSLNPYLTFDGNCRQAFEFYRSVFGGDFSIVMTFADAPPDLNVADADKERVMHMSLPIGTTTLMGSDTAEGFGGPVVAGTNFSLSIASESRAKADELFNKLSAGGEVTMPMQDTFWNSYFGTCRDQFGINWMIDHHLG